VGHHPPVTPPVCPSRRTLLAATGAGLGALALAACGGTAVREVAGAGLGTVLARLDEVPEEGALELAVDGRRLLLVRTGDAAAAYDAECPHQGCAVRPARSGRLVCPCHGSAFDPADGSVLQGPATVPLVPVEVAVAGGEVRLG
jgi:nitrite reductase/ring-hydroxylating ferredoxin subunit